MAEYPTPKPRRNGNGILLLAVIIGVLIVACGVSASRTVQRYDCTTYSCTVTDIPVTTTYGP